MPSRARAGVLFGFVLLLASGCKEQSDAGRPLPAPEPPPTAASQPLDGDVAATRKRPPADEAAPAKPRPPSADAAAPKAPSDAATPPTEAPTTGGGPGSEGSGSAPTAAPSVPPLSAPSAACLARCQTALQGCLAQPVDGGVPGFGNLDLCKKAFEACQAACK